MSDTLSTRPFDHFPRCAFGVGGLDFSCVAVLSIVAVVAVTGFFTCHYCHSKNHMLHVVSTWCLFHSVQIQPVEIRDLERSLLIFFSIDSFESLSRFINLCQHGEAQEKA